MTIPLSARYAAAAVVLLSLIAAPIRFVNEQEHALDRSQFELRLLARASPAQRRFTARY